MNEAPALPGPAIAPPPTSISPAETSSEPAQAGSSMSDAFSSLDKRGGDLESIATAPTPKSNPRVPTRAKPPEQKPVEKAPEKAAAVPEGEPKEPTKPTEAAKPAEAPKPGEVAPVGKPRTGWQRFHEAEKQIKDLTAKLAEKEKVSTMPEDHPELVRMRGEIDKREKRLAEVENHLRYRDYEASTEYQEQYHKPYMQTATEATNRATQLRVKNDVDGTQRALTPEEFWKIVHTDDADSAISAAEQLFGEGSLKANFLIERRNEILLAHQKAEKAKADFKKNAAEITRKQQEDQTRQGTERSAMFKKLMADGIEKDPALYKPEEGDNEGNKLLEQGYAMVDRVFSGGVPAKEGEAPMSAQEMIAAHAEIRNKAAAFDRVAHKNKAMVARIAELEAELAEYETSAPAKGEAGAGEKGPAREDDMESILNKLQGN